VLATPILTELLQSSLRLLTPPNLILKNDEIVKNIRKIIIIKILKLYNLFFDDFPIYFQKYFKILILDLNITNGECLQ